MSPGVGYPVINEGIGYNVGDKVYPFELFLFSALSALLMFVPTYFVYKKNKQFRLEKLRELNVVAQSEDGHADDQPSDGEQAAAQIDIRIELNRTKFRRRKMRRLFLLTKKQLSHFARWLLNGNVSRHFDTYGIKFATSCRQYGAHCGIRLAVCLHILSKVVKYICKENHHDRLQSRL